MHEPERCPVHPVLRAILLGGGGLCVVLAAVGLVVPGMPTTVFLIVAAALLARSHPRLLDRVLEWAPFRPLRPYVERRRPIPAVARNGALLGMWCSIAASSAFAVWSPRLPDLLVPVFAVLGLVGSVVIWRAARGPVVVRADRDDR